MIVTEVGEWERRRTGNLEWEQAGKELMAAGLLGMMPFDGDFFSWRQLLNASES